jgi:predicted 2-oxoglutarate/Fe(II)-dependent dioxygenase YbiX
VNHTVCADQIMQAVPLWIYEWSPFITFLAATMDKDALYPMRDALARVNVMAYRDGEALNWHFDRSEFTTTLLLQAPDEGGDFVYRTDLRNDSDPNYDGVARLLRGEDPEVKSLKLSAGTLNVFRGKNTAHKVSTVRGSRERIIAVFSYFDRPGVVFSREDQIGFYGRTA